MSDQRRQHLQRSIYNTYYRAMKIKGEFFRNYNEQRQCPDKFYGYTRISVETFDYILEAIKGDLESEINPKLYSINISPAEKLYLTLRCLNIPFPSLESASLACDVLNVDKELKRSGVQRKIETNSENLVIIFNGEDLKKLRVAVNGLIQNILLVLKTIDQF